MPHKEKPPHSIVDSFPCIEYSTVRCKSKGDIDLSFLSYQGTEGMERAGSGHGICFSYWVRCLDPPGFPDPGDRNGQIRS